MSKFQTPTSWMKSSSWRCSSNSPQTHTKCPEISTALKCNVERGKSERESGLRWKRTDTGGEPVTAISPVLLVVPRFTRPDWLIGVPYTVLPLEPLPPLQFQQPTSPGAPPRPPNSLAQNRLSIEFQVAAIRKRVIDMSKPGGTWPW